MPIDHPVFQNPLQDFTPMWGVGVGGVFMKSGPSGLVRNSSISCMFPAMTLHEVDGS